MQKEIHRSVCPFDCPDCCGLLVEVENGRAVRITGDPEHHFTRGTLCPKMAHYERSVYSERRLLTPLRRTGRKGEGRFKPISWADAVQEIASQWKNIIKTYGAEAIQPYSYAGTMGCVQHDGYHALFYKLGASDLLRTICSPAKRHGWAAVMGDTRAIRPQEAQKSDLIVLWSLSMLSTDIHFAHDVRAAKAKGARVFAVDTYRTPTAKQADRAFIVRPGTDGALALGILHILAKESITDEGFLKKHTHGWQELKMRILPRYTPAKTAEITGLTEEEIAELAHAYARARAPFIRIGSGFSRYTNGAMSTRLLAILPAAVGAWAKKGGGMLSAVAGSKALDKALVQRPDFKKNVRATNMIEIGNALTTENHPPIKSLFVYASNPACTAPDQAKVTEGLLREDLFTVVHERYMTDTAKYADIVLPATTSLEHSDIYASYGNYTLEIARACIPPLGEAKSNWNTARLLAKAMDIDNPFFDKTEDALVDELIDHTAEKWDIPFDVEALRAGKPVELPVSEDYKIAFKTPSGKIQIVNEAEEPKLPDYFPATGDDEPFHLISAPDPRILDSSFNERTELTRSNIMMLKMHPADAEKLHLETGVSVICKNKRGSARFTLHITEDAPKGTVVTEGVWWRELCQNGRGINMLTSQRKTDRGGGSTFYDVNVCVEAAE